MAQWRRPVNTAPCLTFPSRTLVSLCGGAIPCFSLRLREIVLDSDPDRGFESSAPRTPSYSLFEMGNTASVKSEASDSVEQPATTAPAPETKPKKKICCACPDTKKLRDDCIVQNGEDACGKFIEAHLQCLRAEGFNV